MRALALIVLLVAGPAVADVKPKTPAKTASTVKEPATKQPACKPKKVGKKTICEYVVEKEIVLVTKAPKPDVVIMTPNPRNLVGRPKSDDRLQGLGPHTK